MLQQLGQKFKRYSIWKKRIVTHSNLILHVRFLIVSLFTSLQKEADAAQKLLRRNPISALLPRFSPREIR